ncbi:cellulase [Pollutimonas subterranea]|uniref:Glucanase n=2 Tax=Pollutimonas subterranea TaxID=2045210 RepID=A0A2N4U057_9BURK|nr:cellulose synthase complex periplasmic endoglucanase BcsZ [Pollutimonas subterranea]PLC48377.1 cellulase [Pollutimonas subterranea]
MRKIFAVLCLGVASCTTGLSGAAECAGADPWPGWNRFQGEMITPDGRVIDRSDSRRITTSEGQSYAMFFALVDNDPVLFRRLLRWTELHLASSDLTARLPAWLWGRTKSGEWGVLDTNSASDADLWIAYSLLEAGRLWDEHSYTVLGTLLLQRIAKEEVATLPGFGPVLLPGKIGFVHEASWRLNPSYMPPQLMAAIRRSQPAEPWISLHENTNRFLIASSPNGLAPDWTSWTGRQFEPLSKSERKGSYDAIRVYLWVGMLNTETPGATALKQHFRSIQSYFGPDAAVPESLDIYEGSASGTGPAGFAASLLPLFNGYGVAQALRDRLASSRKETLGYFSQALILFGEGWDEGRFWFEADGSLVPKWKVCP